MCYRLLLHFGAAGVTVAVTESEMISFLFSYWILSFISSHVSGAHYNPAISFAFLFKREGSMSKIVVIFYLLAQFGGAFGGAILSWIITGNTGDLVYTDNKFFPALVIEALASFLLVLIFII